MKNTKMDEAILVVAVVVLFFIPNWLASTILEPSMRGILPGLLEPGEHFDVHISVWHGWQTELFMTIGIVIIGSLLFLRVSRILDFYEYLPRKITLNRAYDQALSGLERMSGLVTNTYMTGSVRHYLIYILGFLVIVVGGGLLLQQAIAFDFTHNSAIELYEYALGFSIIGATIFMVFSKSRLTAIIALSAVGFLISLMYVNFRAPDLALTQLVVETISTTLFLLCFYFLPKLRKDISTLPFRLSNLIVALGVGVTLTLIGLSAQGHRLFEPISDFYNNAYELAGGKNIVNTILVDFRGFDTMLEIVVLFSAGIGVYTLIKLRQSGGDKG